ncbi:cytochrome P450 [Micromonospora sp. WMMD980]|uniref:cytochrome P450 n=1 Tax=Micromonospora sp. WMMD980 TaxID=3016088 RepID=UPI002416AD87|nr:cytochrome P450 [Micromonospora sp. WMMD980]MDG4801405.1 cytochrome P450 [Micromonospora sp. WMMD980]
MTTLPDAGLRARMAGYYDILEKAAGEGDLYARLLRGPADPYPVYEQIRALGPLPRSALGTWVTTDHRIANKVLRDRRFGVRLADGQKVPEFMNFDNSMLGLDPPNHARLRKLTIPALNPRMADKWRDRADELCARFIDELPTDGTPFDLMTEFAQKLPVTVIADLVGIPDDLRPRFTRLSRRIAPLLDGVVSFHKVRGVDLAIGELTDMFRGIIELRQEDPGDDLISQMLPAIDDGRLTMAELEPLCMFLPLAGSETTVNLIGNGVRALLANPDQWDMLRADPKGLAAGVVEETLRFDPPVQQYRRVAHQEIELAGEVLPVDGELAILAAAANRDPAVFDDPHRYDITRRSAADTLSFSAGIHYCLGAPLARVEAEAAFRAIATRLPDLRVAGEPRRRDSFIIHGMLHFPLSAG